MKILMEIEMKYLLHSISEVCILMASWTNYLHLFMIELLQVRSKAKLLILLQLCALNRQTQMVPERIITEMITLIVATIMTVTNYGGYVKLRELVVKLFQRIIFNQNKLKCVL